MLSLIVIMGCGSDTKKLQKALVAVNSVFPSASTSVGKSYSIDTREGKVNALMLELTNVEAIEDKSYSPANLAALAAKTLIDNLKPEEYTDVTMIHVKINKQNESFEFMYKITDLQK